MIRDMNCELSSESINSLVFEQNQTIAVITSSTNSVSLSSSASAKTSHEMMEVESCKSIQHLQAYPVVADTYGYVSNYYSWAKEKSSVVNYTCSLAENSLHRMTTPLVKRFEPQVRVLDEAADKQLRHLEQRFPSVKKPAKEMWNDSWGYCDQTIRVRVNAVRDPLVHRYESMRDTIHAGKEASFTYAKRAIDIADHYVDTYLPSDEDEQEMSSLAEEQEVPQDEPLMTRTGSVLRKTQRRIRRRGQRRVAEAQQAVQNAVTNVIASVGLLETLQKAQAGMADLNEEFWERLHNVQEDVEGSDSSSSSQQSFDSTNSPAVENVVVGLAMRCVRTTNNVLSVLGDMLYYRLDEEKQLRWDSTSQSLHEFYDRLLKSPQTLTSDYLQRMRDLLHSLNNALHSGLQFATDKFQTVKKTGVSTAS